jgi:hypothetical protein
MASSELVLSVEEVQLSILKSDPPQLAIFARGTVRTGGWSNPELVEIIYVTPPADGFYEYEFRATPPTGPSTDALTPIEAKTVRHSIPPELKGVRVIAETNRQEAKLP